MPVAVVMPRPSVPRENALYHAYLDSSAVFADWSMNEHHKV